MKLRPFFSYYGSKWLIAPRYPAPEHGIIIEPFAGAAGYATRYHDRRVRLLDTNPVVVGVWEYLIRASSAEILRLPLAFDHVDEVCAPQEARWLIGYWLNHGNVNPGKTPASWMRSRRWTGSFWGEAIRARLARQVEHIRHWRVTLGGFEEAPDVQATWFIDPPYRGRAGRFYRRNWKIDYERVASWVLSRSGLVIACENVGADWLPFQPFTVAPALRGGKVRGSGVSHEAIYVQRGPGARPQLRLFG